MKATPHARSWRVILSFIIKFTYNLSSHNGCERNV